MRTAGPSIFLLATLAACRCGGAAGETDLAGWADTDVSSAEPLPDAAYEALRAAEDRALLEALVGPVELGDASIRAGHDLGTMRLVVLERPGVAQTLSVLDLAPPEDMSAAEMATAFDDGAGKPLELLGYDRVEVTGSGRHRLGASEAPWAAIRWTRSDEDGSEDGVGRVTWVRCDGSERWKFVSEEIAGGDLDPGAFSDLLGRFRPCQAAGDRGDASR